MKNFRINISFSVVFTVTILILIFAGCKDKDNPVKFSLGTFPDSVYNLEELNTTYDDFNSDLYLIGSTTPIIFSSNRNSLGSQFDLVQGHIWYQFDQTDGNFTVGGDMKSDLFYSTIANKANTAGDDKGPYSIYSSSDGFEYTFTSAAPVGSPLDLYYVKNLPRYGSSAPDVTGPFPVKIFNTGSDDSYICFDLNMDSAYFCSNRGGNGYDIFVSKRPGAITLDSWMNKAFEASTVADSINSSADDQCPFIYKNIMIFTSNRNGGKGGYDLYYSVFRKGKWSSPVNMGDRINSAANEFRPLIGYNPDFTNKMIVFSSDRTGGLGGYDLYLTGYTFPAK